MKKTINLKTVKQLFSLLIMGTLLASVLALSSCSKKDDPAPPPQNNKVMYSGTAKLSSTSVQSTATGSVTAEYDPATKKLSYTFTWKDLTGEIGGFHIHKGDGSIIIHFEEGDYPVATSGTFSGSTILTDDTWIQDLSAGKLYGQIHTQNYPGGELLFPIKKSGTSGGGNNNGGGDGGGDGGYIY